LKKIVVMVNNSKQPPAGKGGAPHGNGGGGRRSTAGVRAAKALLGVIGFGREVFSSFTVSRPTARVFSHHGRELEAGRQLRFSRILLVEDDAQTAQAFMDIIRHHYQFGHVTIALASTIEAAKSFFSHEAIDLVIMDSDLNDEQGDGLVLTEMFVTQRSDIVILANSSSKAANVRMRDAGALGSVGKSYKQMASWLRLNDPAGAGID
jgi:CheY-like chemotaxis protein